MSKRKHTEDEDSDEQMPDVVDVDFDYYNVNASKDYHAIHRLMMQLFGPDAERVQTGPLTDLVVRVAEESGVGSTIKTEEEEDSDPYAVLTVISCRAHAGLKTVIDYVLSKIRADEGFHGTLSSLLQDGHVGLVVSERLINMPVQVVPPMYRMLAAEMAAEGQEFTHLLFVSRVYRLGGVHGFHAEDEAIMAHATHTATYSFTDAAESVGVDVAGRAMLVPGARFGALVRALEETYK